MPNTNVSAGYSPRLRRREDNPLDSEQAWSVYESSGCNAYGQSRCPIDSTASRVLAGFPKPFEFIKLRAERPLPNQGEADFALWYSLAEVISDQRIRSY